MIIDATDLIVGRMASYVAKRALQGEKIDIVNCEKAVVSGSVEDIHAKFKQKVNRKTVAKGPYVSRMPDRFVRRIIRGMLPYKKTKGSHAFEGIMCYIGVPSDFNGKKLETIDDANIVKRQITRFVKVEEICKGLGASI